MNGTRATNAQLPKFLNKATTDWDVFVKNPKLRAKIMEMALDKKFNRDAFRVKMGRGSPGIQVEKVISNATDESFVDFATPNRRVPFITKRGVRFATLEDQKRIAQMNVRDPKVKFRRAKDADLLRRIRKFQKPGRKIR